MSSKQTPDNKRSGKRVSVVLAGEIIQAGEPKTKGDTVFLWPDQVERLRGLGLVDEKVRPRKEETQ